MPLTLTVVTPPASEPVLLADAKDHLRVDDVNSDAQIATLIQVAREEVESFLGRALMPQTLRLNLDCFPGLLWGTRMRMVGACQQIELPMPPLASVSSITYVDTDGATQTLDPSLYIVDANSEPARIRPSYGNEWPATREQINAVAITYTAGYANATAVPAAIKQAILLIIGENFINREAGSPGRAWDTVDRLLWKHRIVRFS